jgi:hypothetical protein
MDTIKKNFELVKKNKTAQFLVAIFIVILFILFFKMIPINKGVNKGKFSEDDLLLVNKIYKFFQETEPDYYTYSDFLAGINNTYTNLLRTETFYILKAKSETNTLTKDYLKSQLYNYR